MVSTPLPAVRTKVPCTSDHGVQHLIGAEGVIVAELGPEVFLVELPIPDDTLVGGAWYDVVELSEDQFERIV